MASRGIKAGLKNTRINGRPITVEGWKHGDLLEALLKGARTKKVTLHPPAGTYDPDLDAQERAAKRGLKYTTTDTRIGRERAATDLGVAQGDITRQQADTNRQYGENLDDLLRARTQGNEDYQTNLQTIGRNFQRLGNQQAQRGRQAGLDEGGFAAQAARKRAANEALDRAPVDLNFSRFMDSSRRAETGLAQARDRSLASIDRSGGQIAESYRRGNEDFNTTDTRAGTELSNFIQDTAAARQYQAKTPVRTGTVLAPPTKAQKALYGQLKRIRNRRI